MGETKINYQNDFLIDTKDISFNRISKNFYTDKKTSLSDKFGNKYELSNFVYDLEKKLFKSKGLKLSDQENNTLDLLNWRLTASECEISSVLAASIHFKASLYIFISEHNSISFFLISNLLFEGSHLIEFSRYNMADDKSFSSKYVVLISKLSINWFHLKRVF